MTKALISKIQNYSTKDGPGLRTTVFFMGCNLFCRWCANPENMKHQNRVFYFKERCRHCGLCVAHAENQSIQFAEVGCKIDREKCTNIQAMVDLCPFDGYELIGKEWEVEPLVKKLLRDREFYQVGEGGVTFSGGEAALQSEFVLEVTERLHQEHIHVCLDTAGNINSDTFRKLAEAVDMVLYDIKCMDEEMHIHCTGVSNSKILENAQILKELSKPTIVRMIVVLGYNDALEDLHKRLDFVKSLGDCIQQVDLLKYHIYGVGKYEKLGMEYPMEKINEPDEDLMNHLIEYGENLGLKMTIGG